MAEELVGAVKPTSVESSEHVNVNSVRAKRVLSAGSDGANIQDILVDASGHPQVDIITIPTVTVNAHAVTNAGTFAVQVNGSALTALQLIDNTVATEGSAALTSGQQIYGKYDSTFPTAVDDGDAVNILTDKYGRLLIGTDPNIVRVEFTHTDVSTAHEVVAASGSNYVYITSFILSVDTASSYWFEDGDAAAITGKFYLAANGGVSWTACPGSPLKTKTVNKALNIKSAGTGIIGLTMTYYLAP